MSTQAQNNSIQWITPKNFQSVYRCQTSYNNFINDIDGWATKIHTYAQTENAKDKIFEIYFNRTMLTQGGGRENIMLKRIKDGTVLAVVFFGKRQDVLGLNSPVTPSLITDKLHELFKTPAVLLDIIMSQSKKTFNITPNKNLNLKDVSYKNKN